MNYLYPAFALLDIYPKEILINVCQLGLVQRSRTTLIQRICVEIRLYTVVGAVYAEFVILKP